MSLYQSPCFSLYLPISPFISLYLPPAPPLSSLLTAKLAPCCNGGVQSLHCSGTIKEDAELNANVTLMVGGGDGSVIVYTVSNVDAAGYEFTETDAVALGPQSDPWQITSVSRLAGPEGLEVIVGVKQGFIYRLRWGNLATAHLACEVRRRGYGRGRVGDRERGMCICCSKLANNPNRSTLPLLPHLPHLPLLPLLPLLLLPLPPSPPLPEPSR